MPGSCSDSFSPPVLAIAASVLTTCAMHGRVRFWLRRRCVWSALPSSWSRPPGACSAISASASVRAFSAAWPASWPRSALESFRRPRSASAWQLRLAAPASDSPGLSAFASPQDHHRTRPSTPAAPAPTSAIDREFFFASQLCSQAGRDAGRPSHWAAAVRSTAPPSASIRTETPPPPVDRRASVSSPAAAATRSWITFSFSADGGSTTALGALPSAASDPPAPTATAASRPLRQPGVLHHAAGLIADVFGVPRVVARPGRPASTPAAADSTPFPERPTPMAAPARPALLGRRPSRTWCGSNTSSLCSPLVRSTSAETPARK